MSDSTADIIESENTETPDAETEATEVEAAESTEGTEQPEDSETFSRSYVEKLRDENAKLRVRAQGTDELRHRLHRVLVEQDGRLADPADLEYQPEHVDAETLRAAIDSLLEAKPHLRSRKPKGDAAQGFRQSAPEPVSLLGLLKNIR